jgi:hypothetical protein
VSWISMRQEHCVQDNKCKNVNDEAGEETQTQAQAKKGREK